MPNEVRLPQPLEIVVDERIATWLDAVWPFDRSAPPFPTAGPPLPVRIQLTDRPFWSGLHDGDVLPGAADTWHHRVDGREFWVWESADGRAPPRDASVVRLSIGDAGVTILACGSPFRSWGALTNAFHEAVALAGAIPFHAAAIHRPATGRDPARTWMMLGRSGRGKTTTLLRAIRAGWTPVAEDVCWLNPMTLDIVGSDTTVGVRPASVAVLRDLLPAEADLPPDGRVDSKVHVSWDALGAAREPFALTHVVELRHAPEQVPGLAPSTGLRTALALYEASGVPRTDRARSLLELTIGHLVERVQPMILGLGGLDRPFP